MRRWLHVAQNIFPCGGRPFAIAPRCPPPRRFVNGSAGAPQPSSRRLAGYLESPVPRVANFGSKTFCPPPRALRIARFLDDCPEKSLRRSASGQSMHSTTELEHLWVAGVSQWIGVVFCIVHVSGRFHGRYSSFSCADGGGPNETSAGVSESQESGTRKQARYCSSSY
ncbi:hypothetical protein B0H11DRAFT_1954002 [Mycena galericulata]|nr:hypothetical protein B0H11DRAFT_1954002 [Mycena galericulata]